MNKLTKIYYNNIRYTGKQLRALRILHGMSLKTMADIIGVTYQQVAKYELGKNSMGVYTIRHLCHHFQVPMSFFLNETKEEEVELSGRMRRHMMVARQLLQLKQPRQLDAVLIMIQSMTGA